MKWWHGVSVFAVQSGWGADAQPIQDALTTNNIGLENNVPQGSVVWGFALKRECWEETAGTKQRRTERTAALFWVIRPHVSSCLPIGKFRMRLPVAAKMAFASAGANGGRPGSPTPLGGVSGPGGTM